MNDVTVIICTFNRADWLREALESLGSLKTNGFTYEVLVVDNASTDHTKDAVMEMKDKVACPVRYVHESEPGVSFARNRGVQESNSTWIAFFDDDELAEPDWLLQLLESAEKHGVKCVGGGVRLKLHDGIDRQLQPWVRVTLGCTDSMQDEMYDGKRVPTTGNMLIHSEIFDKIGLFRTDLVEGGEDTDLYHRMLHEGYQAWHNPNALTHHQIPEFRIKPDYLRSTANRMGVHIARREFEKYGYFKFIPVVIARMGVSAVKHIPKLIIAKFRGDKEMILEHNCIWWMWKGYFSAAFGFLFRRNSSAEPISFRSERELAS